MSPRGIGVLIRRFLRKSDPEPNPTRRADTWVCPYFDWKLNGVELVANFVSMILRRLAPYRSGWEILRVQKGRTTFVLPFSIEPI